MFLHGKLKGHNTTSQLSFNKLSSYKFIGIAGYFFFFYIKRENKELNVKERFSIKNSKECRISTLTVIPFSTERIDLYPYKSPVGMCLIGEIVRYSHCSLNPSERGKLSRTIYVQNETHGDNRRRRV